MKRRALITGITGQDGYYLTKLLLAKGYDVYGMIRRHNRVEHELGTIEEFQDEINFDYGDLTDASSIESIIHRTKPHEVYNLAAQSHVKVSFDSPVYTTQVNALGPVYFMDAIRRSSPYTRFYQASTSEMFGNSVDSDGFQRETTTMRPVSPYGVAKLYAHQMVNVYRVQHNMFACSGILFNHESSKRGDLFVTKKITNFVRKMQNLNWNPLTKERLCLGNLDARRDWGHAEDYVEGMWRMLQHDTPDDYVLSTGKTYSIREFLSIAFGARVWQEWVDVDQKFMRPEDVHHLKGDSSKARLVLGWTPTHDIYSLVNSMIEGK
jgi:GDPmannose 4,6-dehydratase